MNISSIRNGTIIPLKRKYFKTGNLQENDPSSISEEQTPEFDENIFDPDTIIADSNRIYFYSDVDRSTILNLNMSLRKVSVNLISRAFQLDSPVNKIFLHINSNGGTVTDGLIASDYIKKNKVPVTTIIDGACASAATLISIVAKERFIHENSFMLIHQLSAGMWGTYASMIDEITNCNMMMNTLKKVYQNHTKIPLKKLDEILKHDLWFNAKDCLKYGLVDGII